MDGSQLPAYKLFVSHAAKDDSKNAFEKVEAFMSAKDITVFNPTTHLAHVEEINKEATQAEVVAHHNELAPPSMPPPPVLYSARYVRVSFVQTRSVPGCPFGDPLYLETCGINFAFLGASGQRLSPASISTEDPPRIPYSRTPPSMGRVRAPDA